MDKKESLTANTEVVNHDVSLKRENLIKNLGFLRFFNHITSEAPKWFENFSGHAADNVSSFENFVKFLHKPTDAASLGVGRMFFGS